MHSSNEATTSTTATDTTTTTTTLTRNQRLLQLIENANTAGGVRFMAAKQLAISIEHAWPLNNEKRNEKFDALESRDYNSTTQTTLQAAIPGISLLLNRLVKITLGSKNWDVRMGAATALAQSIQGIAKRYRPIQVCSSSRDVHEMAIKILKDFDLPTFMANHEPLVASSGTEYEELDLSAISITERLKQQKNQLKKTLEFMDGISDLTNELIEDRDLLGGGTEIGDEEISSSNRQSLDNSNEATTRSSENRESSVREPSVRERAQLRRKNRAASRQLEAVRRHQEAIVGKKPAAKLDLPHFPGTSIEDNDGWEWLRKDPLWKLVLALRANILNATWTVRHGALLALKEILMTSMVVANGLEWPSCMMGLLTRDVIAVLSLDRFSDFISDQTVAPVRETASQLLTCLYQQCTKVCLSLCPLIWQAALQLADINNSWTARQGGLLCLKYMWATFTSGINDDKKTLDESRMELYRVALQEGGGNDDLGSDEDIRCLALELLASVITTTKEEVWSLSLSDAIELYELVIEIIQNGEMDSPGQIYALRLMVSVILGPSGGEKQTDLMMTSIEGETCIIAIARLLYSPISAVRKEAVQALHTLLSAINRRLQPSTSTALLLVRLLLQRIVLDDQQDICQVATQLAIHLVTHFITTPSKEVLAAYVAGCSMILTPPSRPWDTKHFVFIQAVGPPPLLTNIPPAHEIGFRTADLMIRPATADNGEVISARRQASAVLRIMGRLYDTAIKGRMAQALVGEDSMICYLGIILFGKVAGPPKQMEIVYHDGDGDDGSVIQLSQLRIWMARLLQAEFESYSPSLMRQYLGQEVVRVLQHDIVQYCREYLNFDQLIELLPVLYKRASRKIALGTLRRALLRDQTGTVYGELRGNDLKSELAYSLLVSRLNYSTVARAIQQLDDLEWEEELLLEGLGEWCSTDPMACLDFMVSHMVPWLESSHLDSEIKSPINDQDLTINDEKKSQLNNVHDSVSKKESHEKREKLRIMQCIHYLFLKHDNSAMTLAKVGGALYFLLSVMRKVADSEEALRRLASRLLGELVRLCPLRDSSPTMAIQARSIALDSAAKEAEDFLTRFMAETEELTTEGGSQRRALAMPHYTIPVPIQAQLRPYQQAGVNWLAFLAKYGLNGILADDMGLGKTLQTICILASSHYNREQEQLTRQKLPSPSLVICPSSLIGHWRHEIITYASSLGEPLLYTKPPTARRAALDQLAKSLRLTAISSPSSFSRVVITSYEIARSDASHLNALNWNYIILDEGHMIKNPKSRLKQAIATLRADHRLILSGTPIQNNVVELWSLMDWLMPGMLGDEATFMERYGRPILAVQPSALPLQTNAGSGGDGAQQFAKAEHKLAILHKQVLPFILRRMKEDVLSELPPKIIQDCECEPSSLQQLLCAQVEGEVDKVELLDESSSATDKGGEARRNAFQTLNYLRKICVHPVLVLTPDHPMLPQAQQIFKELGLSSWDDLSLSPKLAMLRELLLECGLNGEGASGAIEKGLNPTSKGEVTSESKTATIGDVGWSSTGLKEYDHRVLIFAQQRSTLDLIERLVLKAHLPLVRYLRLDGNTPQSERFNIAQTFNSDPSYGVLLLTTSVGGLGLNLTGADTVIFVEHDWNPMKDLQAMDRAHRLGQRRVVTVYRLIVKDTLEQRVMGLQRWKRRVAATIVQQQNLTATGREDGTFAKETSTELLELLGSSARASLEEQSLPHGNTSNKRAKKDNQDQVEKEKVQKWLVQHGVMGDEGGNTVEGNDDDATIKEYSSAFDVKAFLQSVG